jgi:hypothetical protein
MGGKYAAHPVLEISEHRDRHIEVIDSASPFVSQSAVEVMI